MPSRQTRQAYSWRGPVAQPILERRAPIVQQVVAHVCRRRHIQPRPRRRICLVLVVDRPKRGGRVGPGCLRQDVRHARYFQLALASRQGQFFDHVAIPVARGTVHAGVDRGRILAQDLLHAAHALEEMRPVVGTDGAQAGEAVGHDLIAGQGSGQRPGRRLTLLRQVGDLRGCLGQGGEDA